MYQGLQLLTGDVWLYIFIGVIVSQIAAIIPGLGGTFALVLVLPFVFRMEPATGIAFVVAINVAAGTGNTITSILFGIPGSPSGVASTFDGYPMTRRGEGIRAVAAALTASMLGGLIGAVVLALSLPFVRPIVLALRAPEFVALILIAIVFMAIVAKQDPLRGLVSGGIGLMFAFIGMEVSTGTQRYTFGQLHLWEGLGLVPVLLGLYAITEMISLIRQRTAITTQGPQASARHQLLQGIRDTFIHWKAVLNSSIAGLWVGMAPGLGDSAAQFIGYAQVARTSKNRDRFGQGEIEGVIAADASTNSKDGGALIPTLAFGIPGTSSYAIIIAVFLAFGIQPGGEMLTTHIGIVWMIIWILVIANILGALFCFLLVPAVSAMTSLRASLIVAPILILSMFGAYASNTHFFDIVVMFLFGIIGYFMKEYGYSRPIMLVGFVLGVILERNLLLSMRLYGASSFTRPIVIALIALLLISFLLKKVRGRRSKDRESASIAPQSGDYD